MNDYEIRFVYELVNVVTYVTADNKEQAKRFGEMNIANTGINLDEEPFEIVATKVGEYL